MISRTEKNKKTHRQIQTIESIEKSRKILSVTVKVTYFDCCIGN